LPIAFESLRVTKTVLIVDDVPMMRNLIDRFLSNAGYKTEQAANGVEALALLDGRKFDLVVCDLQMPNISGIDFTLLVRIHDQYADLPILMVSANTDQEIQNIGRNAGVSEWMGKPFSMTQLIAAVERNIKRPH